MTERQATGTRVFDFDLEGRAAEHGDAIPVVVSTDAVVTVADGPEVLVHSPDAIDLSRAPLPIIASHRGGQVNVGIVDQLRIDGGRLRGMARFGTRAEAAGYREDVLNRIIRSVSVGYARVKAHMRADGVMVTTRWMPSHAALVAEPADVGAGFFREAPAFELQAAEPAAPEVSTPAATAAAQRKVSVMDQLTHNAAGASADDSHHQPSQLPMPTGGNVRAIDMEKARRQGIENLCRINGIDNNIRDHWIGTGLGLKEVSDEMLTIFEERSANTPTKPATALGLSAQEAKRFSLFNAIRATTDKNWTNAGFELECSREVAKKLNKVPDPNRFFVPFEVQERQVAYSGGSFTAGAARADIMAIARRDLTVASAGGGGYLVGTNNVSFIEMLRNRAIAYRAGARRLSGLTGSVTVPRQSAAGTAYWLSSESTSITESNQTFTQMALTPKTVGAYTEISRQLLLQSSPDAEGIVTSDLSAVTALAYDLGVLEGSGSAGQPTGISATGGIGSVTGTSIDFAKVLEFQTDVAAANVMPAAGAYVTTPAVASLLIQRVKYSSTASPIWEGNIWDGMVQGFPAMSSNQLTAATMMFGDWSQVVVAEWGVLEVEVNPYANFQAGIIGVRAIVSMDCGLRYAGAFSRATSIT